MARRRRRRHRDGRNFVVGALCGGTRAVGELDSAKPDHFVVWHRPVLNPGVALRRNLPFIRRYCITARGGIDLLCENALGDTPIKHPRGNYGAGYFISA